MKQYRIALVDDHLLLRDALATMIDGFDGFTVKVLASNGKEAIKYFLKEEDDDEVTIAILDLNMPIMDGYDTADWLKENRPDIKVLILTMYDSEVALIRLLQSGVRGFLKKDIHPADLKAALESVAENGYYYCNSATGRLASFFTKTGRTAIEKTVLSTNEIEFLKLSSTEMTYKEIAAALSLSPRTIDGYRDSLFEKLDVKSRVGLAIYAMKNGIVTI